MSSADLRVLWQLMKHCFKNCQTTCFINLSMFFSYQMTASTVLYLSSKSLRSLLQACMTWIIEISCVIKTFILSIKTHLWNWCVKWRKSYCAHKCCQRWTITLLKSWEILHTDFRTRMRRRLYSSWPHTSFLLWIRFLIKD